MLIICSIQSRDADHALSDYLLFLQKKVVQEIDIDGHAHIVMKRKDVPDSIRKQGIFDILEPTVAGGKSLMYQKINGQERTRPVDHPGFFLEPRLEWMEKHKIDHAIIFPLSQLYGNQLSKELVYDAHKRHNDFNWGLQDGHDSKFTSSFTVNPRYIDQALEEIQRCVDMGMSILGLCTHYIPETINGKPNTNKLYIAFGEGEQDKQILDLANKHGLAIQFHPYDMEHIINIPNTRWRHHLGFMASLTEDSYATTTSNNYHNDYPNINFHFAHGGGSSLITFGRRKQGSLGRPDLVGDIPNPYDAQGASNISFDILTHDPHVLKFAIETHGIKQFAGGEDSLYPLGDFYLNDKVKEDYTPFKVLDEAQELGFIDRNQRQQILYDNNIARARIDPARLV